MRFGGRAMAPRADFVNVGMCAGVGELLAARLYVLLAVVPIDRALSVRAPLRELAATDPAPFSATDLATTETSDWQTRMTK